MLFLLILWVAAAYRAFLFGLSLIRIVLCVVDLQGILILFEVYIDSVFEGGGGVRRCCDVALCVVIIMILLSDGAI